MNKTPAKAKPLFAAVTCADLSRICKLAMFQSLTPATFSLPDDYAMFAAVLPDMEEDDVIGVLNVVRHFISVSKLNGVRFHAHNESQVASLKRFEALVVNLLGD